MVPVAGKCCGTLCCHSSNLPQFIAIVVTVIGALRSFDMIATMTQGGPFGSTNVLAYYMYDQAVGEGVGRYGYGSAIATVLFFIMLIYISYFLWRMYQDEMEEK